jgi:hypothetical protein
MGWWWWFRKANKGRREECLYRRDTATHYQHLAPPPPSPVTATVAVTVPYSARSSLSLSLPRGAALCLTCAMHIEHGWCLCQIRVNASCVTRLY